MVYNCACEEFRPKVPVRISSRYRPLGTKSTGVARYPQSRKLKRRGGEKGGAARPRNDEAAVRTRVPACCSLLAQRNGCQETFPVALSPLPRLLIETCLYSAVARGRGGGGCFWAQTNLTIQRSLPTEDSTQQKTSSPNSSPEGGPSLERVTEGSHQARQDEFCGGVFDLTASVFIFILSSHWYTIRVENSSSVPRRKRVSW